MICWRIPNVPEENFLLIINSRCCSWHSALVGTLSFKHSGWMSVMRPRCRNNFCLRPRKSQWVECLSKHILFGHFPYCLVGGNFIIWNRGKSLIFKSGGWWPWLVSNHITWKLYRYKYKLTDDVFGLVLLLTLMFFIISLNISNCFAWTF